jgi:hypothetical protein
MPEVPLGTSCLATTYSDGTTWPRSWASEVTWGPDCTFSLSVQPAKGDTLRPRGEPVDRGIIHAWESTESRRD